MIKKIIYVILIFAFANSCKNKTEKDDCENAVQFPKTFEIEAFVAKKPNFSGELTNYWGDDNSKIDIIHTIKNGKAVRSQFFHENGQVEEEYNYKCHSVHGFYKLFYPNGQIAKLYPYKYGRLDGIGYVSDSLGNIIGRLDFKNDSIVNKTKFEKALYQFPQKNNFTKEYLKENFYRCHYNLEGEPRKYAVILPNDVKPTELKRKSVGDSIYNIGIYQRVKSAEPYLEIYCYTQHVDEKIQPADWALNLLEKFGQNLISQRNIVSPQGNRYADLLSCYESKEEKSIIIARTTEYVNKKGDYFLLAVFCKEKDYAALAETIQHITSTWEIEE